MTGVIEDDMRLAEPDAVVNHLAAENGESGSFCAIATSPVPMISMGLVATRSAGGGRGERATAIRPGDALAEAGLPGTAATEVSAGRRGADRATKGSPAGIGEEEEEAEAPAAGLMARAAAGREET